MIILELCLIAIEEDAMRLSTSKEQCTGNG